MKSKIRLMAALLIAMFEGGAMNAMADSSIPHGPYWFGQFYGGLPPVAERTVVTTTVVRHRRCGCHAGTRIRSERSVTVSQVMFSNQPSAIAERTVTTTYSSPRRYFITRTVVYRSGPPLPVGERIEMEEPVVGGRQIEMIRTTPTAVGEGPTEPGPTVSPAYPNAWVDYNNPYR